MIYSELYRSGQNIWSYYENYFQGVNLTHRMARFSRHNINHFFCSFSISFLTFSFFFLSSSVFNQFWTGIVCNSSNTFSIQHLELANRMARSSRHNINHFFCSFSISFLTFSIFFLSSFVFNQFWTALVCNSSNTFSALSAFTKHNFY